MKQRLNLSIIFHYLSGRMAHNMLKNRCTVQLADPHSEPSLLRANILNYTVYILFIL